MPEETNTIPQSVDAVIDEKPTGVGKKKGPDKNLLKKNDNRLQGSMYDKLFRENMLEILPGIIEHVLKLDIITIEELKDDIQYTKERKTDLLKKVSDGEGNKYVLHIEYQTDDYPKMHFRMAEYSIMLQRKYDLPVSQFVIYIGPGAPTMPTTIETKDLQFRYSLKAISSIDYSALHRPLCTALHVLVKLRNLGTNLEQVMMTISKFFKEEEDLLYRAGQKRGIEKGIEQERAHKNFEFVERLLEKAGWSDEQTADVANVSVAYVNKVRQELASRK